MSDKNELDNLIAEYITSCSLFSLEEMIRDCFYDPRFSELLTALLLEHKRRIVDAPRI